jgi:predicted methyltransferase
MKLTREANLQHRIKLAHALVLVSAIAGVAAGCATQGKSPASKSSVAVSIQQAVADSRRPAGDLALDATRHGADVLALADIKPGWKVADLMQGQGYYTRLFVAKVGDTGKVYAWSPEEFIASKPDRYETPLTVLAKDYPGHLVPMRSQFDALVFPEQLDLIFTSQNYHDLHEHKFKDELAAQMNAKVFKSLKPGGIYLVVDHVANPDTVDAPNTVHRIDPAVLRKEIEAAGFKFDGESNALRNPSDDHKLMVMNPVIRGHTDQIIYRSRKPS